jgi:hypothetical protein
MMRRLAILTATVTMALAGAPAVVVASTPNPQLCEYETCGGQSSALYWATRHAVEDWDGRQPANTVPVLTKM